MLALVCLGQGACSGSARRSGGPQAGITVRGSDTMVIIAQSWAEAFMREHDAVVQVSGGGSGTGFAALIDGTADLANASRAITREEEVRIVQEHAVSPVEFEVALDAIAIYVHEDNPLPSIEIEELAGLYRGHIETWDELGVSGLGPIILYSRENNSGTYAYFKEHVLEHADFAAEAQTLPGTAAVISAVSKDEAAIGYGGIGYAVGVRQVPIEVDGEAIEPNLETARSGRYPLARPLYIYTLGQPEGVTRQYLDFIRSEDGQALVEGLGYFPLEAPVSAVGS